MNLSQMRSRLKELYFSSDLPDRDLDRLAEIGEFRECKAGTMLFREGDDHSDLYLIIAGRMALDMNVPGRGAVRVLTLGPGDLLAWSAILGGPMTTSATALDDTRLIAVSGERLNDMCREDAAFAFHWMRAVAVALSRRLLATRLQLLDLFANPSSTEPAT